MPKNRKQVTIFKINKNGEVFNILRSLKNIFVHIRNSLKFVLMISIIAILVIAIMSAFYKPIYAVTLNGEFVGYTEDKNNLQQTINEEMNGIEEESIAFVDIATLPEYSLCFVKRNTEDNSEQILDKIRNIGETYYTYYAILLKDEEKYYVSSKDEAENIIDELKKKDSNNIKDIAYTKIYSKELKEYSEKDTIVTALYEKKVVVPKTYTSGAYTVASAKIDLGIDLIKPISSGYTITSRFGLRASGNHTGLDVAAPTGTQIHAAAAGTVIVSGWSNSGYGYHVIIDHGNGVHTLYGHCSALYVSEGQYVNQGDAIAAVGSTGNSTGPHLHLEIRVNGARYNPQYYLY